MAEIKAFAHTYEAKFAPYVYGLNDPEIKLLQKNLEWTPLKVYGYLQSNNILLLNSTAAELMTMFTNVHKTNAAWDAPDHSFGLECLMAQYVSALFCRVYDKYNIPSQDFRGQYTETLEQLYKSGRDFTHPSSSFVPLDRMPIL
jgi:hypothetical protein